MNGSAAALVLIDDPVPPTPAAQDGSTVSEIEAAIGNVIADTAAEIGASVHLDGGVLTPERRSRTGDLFVQLFQLQQSHPEVDFTAVGKRALRRRLEPELGCRGRTDAEIDAVVSEIVDWPLDILRKVSAVEKAWAN